MDWRVPAAVAVFAVLALLAVWLIPRRQASRWAERGIAGKDLVQLETGARGALIQLLGGVALILTFVATWLQISDTRTTAERTLDLTSSQQISQRFTEAVEQLDSKRSEIRIGGIYGLESVAAESPSRRTAITQVLMSYLRRQHPNTGSSDLDVGPRAHPMNPVCGSVISRNVVDDMQAALSVVVRYAGAARPTYQLRRMLLANVRIDPPTPRAPGADFRGADLRFTSLALSYLERSRFDGASLEDTGFTWACLRGASFRGAKSARGVNFKGADLRGADFTGARFYSVDLRGADLTGARLPKDGSMVEVARKDGCTQLPGKSPTGCTQLSP
jgi:Pentapeptide repeats (8 copies)